MSHGELIKRVAVGVFLCWPAVLIPSPLAGADESLLSAGPRPPDAGLAQAKQLYAHEMTEIERAAARIVDAAVREAKIKADALKLRDSHAARDKLLAAYAVAIEQAVRTGDLLAASTLTAEQQALEGVALPESATKANVFQDNKIYRSVLGTYGRFGGRKHPVANLSIPDKNLWNEEIQSKLRGQIDFEEIEYHGRAHIVVPSEAEYLFEFPQHTHVQLNGKAISSGNVALKTGAYAINIHVGTHGGSYILESFLRIRLHETGEEIPLLNSGADINAFLATEVDGRALVEVSGYEPTEVAPPSLTFSADSSAHVFDGMRSLLKF